MSTKSLLTVVAFVCVVATSFGQRTDNCTLMAHEGFSLCGGNKCCCKPNVVICSGWGHELTYIPYLQQTIKSFRFEGNYLQYLNKKSFSNITIKNIRGLSLANNSIWNISDDTFSDFVRVNNVNLDRNNLIELSAKPFQRLQSLIRLSSSNNYIQHIANDAIQQSIRHINLSHNHLLVDTKVPSWFCSSDGYPIFPRLLDIELEENLITKLTNDSFKCLGKLQRLGLDRNVVETIDQNTFAYLFSLERINFSRMRRSLRKVSNCAFNNSNMERLSFRENYITFKPDLALTIFQHSTNIRFLDISLNSLMQLSPDQILGMFSPMKKLEHFYAERCHIHALPVSFVSVFPNLTELDLTGNSIHTLDYFSNVYNLKILILRDNSINSIKAQDLSDNFMNSLEGINLSKNPFDCTCALLWFRLKIKDGKIGNISLLYWPYQYQCITPSEKKQTLLIDYKPTKLSCENILEISTISLGVLLVVAFIISILSFRYRWYIKYWFYKLKTNRKNPETRPLLCPDSYDGYVIYHTEDSQFVHQDLRLFMEEKHSYKLHIWERNAPAGCSELEAMVDGIHASEHAIAVISKNSIQDSWVKFQMDVALGRQVELKRHFLILLILEDVDFKSLSKYWCVVLTRQNVARWFHDEMDVKYAVFEQQMSNHFGKPKQLSE